MHQIIGALTAHALLAPEGAEPSSGGAPAPAAAAAAAPAEPPKPDTGPLPKGMGVMAALAEVQAQRERAEAGAKPPEGQPAPDGKEKPAQPAAEPPLEPPKPPPEPEEEPVATRERLALRQREQALAAREKELEGKAKLSEADATELASFRAARQHAPLDPLGYLEAGGLTWEKVAEAVAKGRAPVDPAARQALEKAQALEKKLAEQEAARAKAEEQAGLERFRGHVAETIKTGGEALEFLAAKGQTGIDDVQQACLAYFQKHGKAPDVAKIAQAIDAHYEKEFREMGKLKRAQPKPPPAPAATPPKAAEPPPTKTLTNGMDGRPPPVKPGADSPRSTHEAILRDLQEIQKARGANG